MSSKGPKSWGGLTAFPEKAHSMYGGGLEGRTRISCSSRVGAHSRGTGGGCGLGGVSCFGHGCGGGYGEGFARKAIFRIGTIKRKVILQNLNDRPASYLEKMKDANAIIKRQTCENYERKGAITQRDYSPYWNIIIQISNPTTHNTNILL